MGKILDAISPELASFIEEQPLFFVGTAPLASSGHVNLSPKGLDTFRILSPARVAYLDLTGSGNETAAHLQENGRITFMFCSFGKNPRILRLYGRGRVVLPDAADWPEWAERFPSLPGARQIVVGEVEMVQTSCGFGVPLMDLVEPRETLTRWAEAKGPEGLRAYWREKNARSLDGLPAPGRDAQRPAGGTL
ncbi:MAG TPA: pyridoxamine 5'-phosphate oxidase family protein [Thermoanaerobaculia bacterium]|jgi:hypothetical protein|nr:pyridoxamine 5'-phosphate oxidase family protein [Thermoanaerobaculia bacterium]